MRDPMAQTGETNTAAPPFADARRMQLRYGFNEIYGCEPFSRGKHRELIHRRHRLMGTQVVRLFVFDQPVPDPFKEWHLFAGTVQAVLDIGATPMVTFAKFPPPYDNPRNIRNFIARCSEVLWGCIEQWGGEAVKDWYWCIWNEPNNPIVGGDLTFDEYRRIYEGVAAEIVKQLGPYLGGRKPKIGGPAIDGTHRPYWLDWIARLVNEVDDSVVSFVSWHRYGDWRPAVPSASLNLEMWDSPDAPEGKALEALLMAQTPQYEARSLSVAQVLHGRDILNVCGELNTISHHENYYTLGLNQNMFGAAYYASALIGLLRGGADLEMRWTATSYDEQTDAYGLMTMNGDPTPACLAKQLFAQHVRYGDWIRFPRRHSETPEVDAVVAGDDNGRRSGVFVNMGTRPHQMTIADWDKELSACSEVLRLDSSTGDRVVREPFDGTVRINGYGIAVVTDATNETQVD